MSEHKEFSSCTQHGGFLRGSQPYTVVISTGNGCVLKHLVVVVLLLKMSYDDVCDDVNVKRALQLSLT